MHHSCELSACQGLLMKPCAVCGIMKPLESFYRHSFMVDGHINKCILCVREMFKKAYALAKERPKRRYSKHATQECTGCCQLKFLTDFYVHATGRYGRGRRCKKCIRDYRREKLDKQKEIDCGKN